MLQGRTEVREGKQNCRMRYNWDPERVRSTEATVARGMYQLCLSFVSSGGREMERGARMKENKGVE